MVFAAARPLCSTLPLRPEGGVTVLLSPALLSSIDESMLVVDFWPGEDGAWDMAAFGSSAASVDVFVVSFSSPFDGVARAHVWFVSIDELRKLADGQDLVC